MEKTSKKNISACLCDKINESFKECSYENHAKNLVYSL